MSTTDLLLLSGGLDSAALAALYRPAVCLTIDYGQQAANAEVQASREICRELNLPHAVVVAPLGKLGAGLMAGHDAPILSRHPEFWPFRNTLLITLGAAYAARHGHGRVLIGTTASDSRHCDGSGEFLEAMAHVIRMQEGAIEVVAPGREFDAVELVRRSGATAAVLGWTHSCHAGAVACGVCPGCLKHSNTMEELGWNR